MNRPSRQRPWLREELLHLLSLSGNMAGLCITGVTLFYTVGRASRAATIADDLLAICALVFLCSAYLIFFALRMRDTRVTVMLEHTADTLFVVGMTLMVATGVLMAYTVW
ncbi:MAG: hypothetical protein IT492_17045 [Gammaproteobacteria bacterium]|nr:hypothetical protein [Gammaproteobacteria bacterium]